MNPTTRVPDISTTLPEEYPVNAPVTRSAQEDNAPSYPEPSWLRVFFDDLGSHYLISSLYRKYADSLELTGDETVLDFGCASGPLSRHIARILLRGNGRVTCLDVSERWMNAARKRLRKFPNVDFVLGDISTLSSDKPVFDVIVIHFMLHDLEQEIRQETIEALSRLLRSTGKIFIREPTKESHGMPAADIRELMNNAGLAEIRGDDSSVILIGPIYSGVFARPSSS